MSEKKAIERIWDGIAAAVIRQRKAALLVAAVLIVASLAVAPTIPFNADVTEYLPSQNADVEFWNDLTHRFGALDLLLIGLEEPGRELDTESLISLARITDELSEHKSDGILMARSITNVSNIKEGDDGTLNASLLMQSIPRTEEARAELMKSILGNTQVNGSMVSNDLKAYMVLVRVDNRKDSRDVAALVKDIVEKERGDLIATYFGAPFIAGMITNNVYVRLVYIIPIFLLLLFAPLIFIVRNIKSVLVILLSAGLSVLIWLGLLGALRVDLTASASNAALFIVVIAAVAFARGYEESSNTPFSARIMTTLLAAAVGLIAVSTLSIPYMQHFGTAAAVGMLAVALAGLLIFAPLASFLAPPKAVSAESTPQRFSQKTSAIIVIVLIAVGLAGTLSGRFLINPKEIFMQEDEVGRSLNFFDRKFGGSDILQISAKGSFREPANAARLMRLSDLLEGSGLFSDVRSASQVLAFLNEQFSGMYRIPSDTEALGNLWFFMEGNEDLRPLMMDERDEAMIAARIPGLTEIPISQWAGIAEEAVKASTLTGVKSGRLRIKAIAEKYGYKLDESALNSVLADVGLDTSAAAGVRSAKVVSSAREYLLSPSSPFTPTEDDLILLSTIIEAEGADIVAAMSKAIASMSGFKEMDYPPEMADDLARTLTTNFEALQLEYKADELLEKLKNKAVSGKTSAAFDTRVRGVFADLLDKNYPTKDNLIIKVSGFPAIIPLVDGQLLHNNWLAAIMLCVIIALVSILLAGQMRPTFFVMFEAALASLLTFAFGAFSGSHIDSACATIYLLPPVVMFFVSGRMASEEKDAAIPARHSHATTLAFALAGLSLLASGVLPVMRLGGVMAVGMALALIIPAISRRLSL